MATLAKSLRNQLEHTVKDARDGAEAAALSALEQLGVGDAGPPSHLSDEERDFRRRLRIHGRQLGDQTDDKKRTQQLDRLVEEVAYEHWHRMLFARFLAENGLLMYPDPHEPVAISLDECADLAADESARNGWELAARFAAGMLPQIFRVDSPVFEIQLPPEHQQQLEKFVSGLPMDVFTASDSLGWVYQFWQARRKKQVNDSEVKIGARELPAVTQLFTEDYMVDFLLDNTLGAWHAGKVLSANPKLAETAKSEDELRSAVALLDCPWEYLRFINSENGKWSPAAGTFEGWPTVAKELKCLDPCMGSGHFVVAMFGRLVALRMEQENLDESDAVSAVIRDNLFGLEIDPRCTQIAAFNVALAAWRRVGYCTLPPMNLACSGLSPNASEEEWVKLAGGNEKLENGMRQLYQLFENAPVLGSLINPRTVEGNLLEAAFHELQPLLERALAMEIKDDTAREMVVTAQGVAKAAEILSGHFTLVATNVPYLGDGKQHDLLRRYCDRVHFKAKADLATCFVERCVGLSDQNGGSAAIVTPQNWLFLVDYKNFRRRLLEHETWQFAMRLGARAFETISGEVVSVALIGLTASRPAQQHELMGIDVSVEATMSAKAMALLDKPVVRVSQAGQLRNADWAVMLELVDSSRILGRFAGCYQGISSTDSERLILPFWELNSLSDKWIPNQNPPDRTDYFRGREFVIDWETMLDGVPGAAIRGNSAYRKSGIAIGQVKALPATLYTGERFADSSPVIIPNDPKNLAAVWCFVSSPEFNTELRKTNAKFSVNNGYVGKVPFDLAYWQKVAHQKYPNGLPKPFSSDPTQWLFNGHPNDSANPLQVAVARLTGYKWPRQTGSSFSLCPVLGPDGLETLADKDGIVCIPPVRGEASAADRLLNLLAKACGQSWSSDVLPGLLKEAGYAGKSLETWLRDGFFQQHCELFHQRPFVWQVWDGLRDGFSALVNYHKLDRKNLETLIYTYLGDWITRCASADKDNGLSEDGEKTTSAKNLKRKLELILEGEAPNDIFVRWKPLHQQAIGWEPDINDGVRMNIRPFLSVPDVKKKGAGVLREKPKIKWAKDRGKEPQRCKEDYPWFWGWDEKTTDFTGGPEFKGERFNNCHYSIDFKRRSHKGAKWGAR